MALECRSDPILVLTDGRHLKVVARLAADPDRVTRMTVVVHGPAATALGRVLYVGPDRFPESVEYVADGEGPEFVALVTLEAAVDVAVTILVQCADARAEASGRTNAPVRVLLTP